MPQRLPTGQPLPLYSVAQTRAIEHAAAASLPPHTLMQRAGLAVARLALALAPHARTLWIACGPGNNGGDGLEAAMHLRQWGMHPIVTWLGDETALPGDARASLHRARAAGVAFASAPPALSEHDLCIDALLGIGATRAPQDAMAAWLAHMAGSRAACLAVDLPSGLNADTGQQPGAAPMPAGTAPRHTLSLLTLKPGLFTAHGRDACGTLWFDPLGVALPPVPPTAWLNTPAPPALRPHASHKGSFGDVAIIGGEHTRHHHASSDHDSPCAMTGAALLAARAALHGGAGRVYVSLLGGSTALDAQAPELMFRPAPALALPSLTVVCGCGGGQAVHAVLPAVLAQAARAVLDADALNAIAHDPGLQAALTARTTRGQPTVLTPHPLEAARLLACPAAQVQADRLAAASALAQRFQCTVVLKGSGTVIAAPGQVPRINPTGCARLATAGTGDVLAGLLGAYLAASPASGPDAQRGTLPPSPPSAAFTAACQAVWQHGATADGWPPGQSLTASALAKRLGAV
ncbi:MAG: NAD(P)H-hydrate dehydratase [Pseudomonadota bacterium]|nr:NAD(P)H-hydrate dehydratase [Pseudomonadota bacterium]